MWVQGGLTKKQDTEEWSNISKSSQRKAINKWAEEQAKLNTAKEQRGMDSFPDDDPDDRNSPHQPTRTVQTGSDFAQVIGLRWKRKD